MTQNTGLLEAEVATSSQTPMLRRSLLQTCPASPCAAACPGTTEVLPLPWSPLFSRTFLQPLPLSPLQERPGKPGMSLLRFLFSRQNHAGTLCWLSPEWSWWKSCLVAHQGAEPQGGDCRETATPQTGCCSESYLLSARKPKT